jgi:hypothetical protein
MRPAEIVISGRTISFRAGKGAENVLKEQTGKGALYLHTVGSSEPPTRKENSGNEHVGITVR